MRTTKLLATVVAVGSAKTHISGGWRLPGGAIPVMRSDRPSTLYS